VRLRISGERAAQGKEKEDCLEKTLPQLNGLGKKGSTKKIASIGEDWIEQKGETG